MKFRSIALAATAVLAFAAPSFAHTVVYTAPLLGSSENPANASTGFGATIVTLDLDLATLRVQAIFGGLTGNTTASHIHCCTTTPGANAIVATQTPTFVDFPLGVKYGAYDHTFDLTLASSYNAAFITANGGTVATAFNALTTGLNNGRAYLNIHTSTFGGGEIRGNLTAPAVVPLPAAAWLLVSGVGALGMFARRRKLRATLAA